MGEHVSGESFDPGRHGSEFERELGGYFFKCLIDANLKDFKFTREKKGLGKFDDLAFICETDDGRKGVYLAQLKHIEKDDKVISYYDLAEDNKSGYFWLPKYLDYYRESCSTIFNDKDFVGANLNALYMCTNIKLQDNLGSIKLTNISGEGILKNLGSQYQLHVPNEIKREIFPKSYLSAREILADEIVSCLMLRKRIDINSMKSNEVASTIKDYHIPLGKYVVDVQGRKLKECFFESSVNEDVEKLKCCIHHSLTKFHNKYRNYTAQQLQNILKIRSEDAKFVEKSLHELKSAKNINEFLMVQPISVNKDFGKVTPNCSEQTELPKDENVCVDDIDKEIDNFFKLLIFVTNINKVKEMTEESMSADPVMRSLLYKAFSEKMEYWFYWEVKKEQKVLKREWKSKEKLVSMAMKSTIEFQGEEIILKQLISHPSLLNPDFLMRVFCSQKTVIGKSLPVQNEVETYYISRTITTLKTKTISYADSLRNEVVFSENDLGGDFRFIILVAEPGMGKSCYMDKMAVKIAKERNLNNDPYWVIRVPLNQCSLIPDNLNNFKSLDNVLKFFAHFESCNDDFSLSLLRTFIVDTGKAIILLDGFDEIHSDKQQEEILSLLTTLKQETKVKQVWVSTRPHLQKRLEDCLDVTSFTLKEISENEQEALLVKYWRHNSDQSESKLLHLAKTLLQKFDARVDKRSQSFLGIPLQAYMLGVIFSNEIKKDEAVIPDQFSLVYLFEQFLNIKYKFYFQKENVDLKNKNYQRLIRTLDNDHQDMAIINGGVLSRKEFQHFVGSDSSFIVDDLLDVGVVVKDRGHIHFVHKSFAEYLIAKRFLTVYKNKDKYRPESIEIIKMRLSKSVNEFLSCLFDYMLVEDYPLHQAALKGEIEKIENIIGDDINSKDFLGRSVLYYTLQYNQGDVLDKLLAKNVKVDINDSYFIGYFMKNEINFKKALLNDSFSHINVSSHMVCFKLALYLCENKTKENECFISSSVQIFVQNAKLLCLMAFPFKELDNLFDDYLKTLTIIRNFVSQSEISVFHANSPLEMFLDFQKCASFMLDLSLDELLSWLEKQEYFRRHVSLVNEGCQYVSGKFNYVIGDALNKHFFLAISQEMLDQFDMVQYLLDTYCRPRGRFQNFISYLEYVKNRARNLTVITRNLMKAGVRIYGEQGKNILLDLFIHVPYFDLFNEKSLETLKNSVDQGLVLGEDAEDVNCIWNLAQEYKIGLQYEEYYPTITSPCSGIIGYVIQIVGTSSEAVNLLDLFCSLHSAIEEVDVSEVSSKLQQAEKHGWVLEILNAINEQFENAEDVADKRQFNDILRILKDARANQA